MSRIEQDTAAFFDLLSERRFTDAERQLASLELGIVFIKTRAEGPAVDKKESQFNRSDPSPEYITGYVRALEGVLVAARSSDERALFNRLPKDRRVLERYRRDFLQFRDDILHSTFDRGFFSAWVEYLEYSLKRLEQKGMKSSA